MLSPDRLRQGSGESRRSEANAEKMERGQHVMAVCNACRYCEGYCPVFPAMENRVAFAKGDLAYLANLCHNCGECLYACQYAPPHEFGIDVPRTLAEIRLASYEEYCWPTVLAARFPAQQREDGAGDGWQDQALSWRLWLWRLAGICGRLIQAATSIPSCPTA